MITSREYLGNSHQHQDLLAAFSALDHSVTETLSEGEIQGCFERLMFRLLALSEVHGRGTAERFLAALEGASPETMVDTAIDYLEIGKRPDDDLERAFAQRRELQQELLHFSRIVDLQDQSAGVTNKRLRNSKILPESLKVFCELVTVARGRILQRGGDLAVPRARPDQQVQSLLGPHCLLVHDKEPSDYLLVLAGDAPPTRKDLAFLYASLLTYLTPYEAVLAMAVHIRETRPAGEDLTLCLVESAENNRVPVTRWKGVCPGEQADPFEPCRKNLPTFASQALDEPMAAVEDVGIGPWLRMAPMNGSGIARIEVRDEAGASKGIRMTSCGQDGVRQAEMVAKAIRAIQSGAHREVKTIESGHIHLDRRIDEDQTLGMAIGYSVCQHLAKAQERPPSLSPMVDDDHVLVQLSAKDYEDYFRKQNPDVGFELIPESSPIIRAIVCGLVANVGELRHKRNRMTMQGGNLILRVPEENLLCELFEDYHGKCDNGCVLFEVALLIYRSDPEAFTQAFQRLFDVKEDIHRRILGALDPGRPHDEIIAELREYSEQFKAATDPRNPCPVFKDLVGKFLADQGTVHVHLNVLEDYYEAQQYKVRRLLRFFEIPVELLSIHFNRLTGRVHLEHRADPKEE